MIDNLGQRLVPGGRHSVGDCMELELLDQFATHFLGLSLLLFYLAFRAGDFSILRRGTFVPEGQGYRIERDVLHALRLRSVVEDKLNARRLGTGDCWTFRGERRHRADPGGVCRVRVWCIRDAQDVHRGMAADIVYAAGAVWTGPEECTQLQMELDISGLGLVKIGTNNVKGLADLHGRRLEQQRQTRPRLSSSIPPPRRVDPTCRRPSAKTLASGHHVLP